MRGMTWTWTPLAASTLAAAFTNSSPLLRESRTMAQVGLSKWA